MPFPWRWTSGTISTNLDVIWGMSAHIANRPDKPPELFDDQINPIPATEELVRAGWPGRKDRLARAIVAVSLQRRGRDFADGAPANLENVRKREYHHLFPISVLAVDRDDPYANRAMNCALITWRTNRKIAARTPKSYIDERAKDAILGEQEVRQRLESHMVPFDALVAGDYEEFLAARAELVHAAAVKLCSGEQAE